MGNFNLNFTTYILFPGGGRVDDLGVVVVEVVSPKEEERNFF